MAPQFFLKCKRSHYASIGNAFGSMKRLEIGLEMTDFTEIGHRITDMTKMDMPSGY